MGQYKYRDSNRVESPGSMDLRYGRFIKEVVRGKEVNPVSKWW